MTPADGLGAQDLAKRYSNVVAVARLSLVLKRGEVVSLLGPNGSGKSTVYRMLTGSESPDSGRISIDGLDVTDLPSYARARCGLSHLPQERSTFRGLSVEDNIRLALEAQEPDADIRKRRLDEIISEMDLEKLRHRKPAALSGGETRRCEIARLLTRTPRYLLLDEPFSGMDPLATERFTKVILDLKQRGVGILLTDHNIRAALAISDRTIVIAQGQVLADSAPSEIIDTPKLRGLWLGPDFKL